MQQLRDLNGVCAALSELTKVRQVWALTMGNWTSILSFKNGDNFQIVKAWTLPLSDTSAETRQHRKQDGVTHAHRSDCCVDVGHVGSCNAIRGFTVLHEQD
jgi:hypothetical protein